MIRILIVFFFIVSALVLVYNQKPQPFQITEDLPIVKKYEKSAEVPQKDQLNFIYYTNETKKLIEATSDSDLLDFRCSDSFIRTVQGAYVLENEKTEFGEKRRIKNLDFIEFMRNKEPTLSKDKRILSGRICELKDKTILLMYSIGAYNPKDADFQTPRLVVLNSSNNSAFLQVISQKPFAKIGSVMEIRESKDHVRCDRLFQISRAGIVYMLCEEKGNFVSSFFIYRINLKLESFEVLKKCINRYEKGLKIFCS